MICTDHVLFTRISCIKLDLYLIDGKICVPSSILREYYEYKKSNNHAHNMNTCEYTFQYNFI